MASHLGQGWNKWSELATGETNGRAEVAGEGQGLALLATNLGFLVQGPVGRLGGSGWGKGMTSP